MGRRRLRKRRKGFLIFKIFIKDMQVIRRTVKAVRI